MKFVIAAGGTGGHVYPALSVARALAPHAVVFVGTRQGPEAEIVPQAGFSLRTIPARKLDRRLGPGALWSLAVSAGGVVSAVRLLRAERAQAVLGTGGYAAAPVVFAAWLLRLPVAILEGDAHPGRANRLLGRLARRVFLATAAAQAHFPAGCTVVTGLPIRLEIARGDGVGFRRLHGLDPARRLLFLFGGSRGAQRLNTALIDALPALAAAGIQIVHQTGKENYESVRGQIAPGEEWPAGYVPVPYVEDMAGALAAADLVVCRAGSSTLAEVTAAGKPAILVPYPYAVGDHQTHNARALVDAGAAVLVPDRELDGARLASEVGALLADGERRTRMAAASLALGRPDAAARVAVELVQIAGK
ncbi:MAG: undecaprenyldiphospho-muramoylpentapeptide beta-N-acetylglucosaminyltransferase [Armatimonadetes bacterium]|nr:undecaprenyldiphospho-muramoylpentapeptide beta-N-acetylglucosaminyltransferase [Armatimonadota bacterium]